LFVQKDIIPLFGVLLSVNMIGCICNVFPEFVDGVYVVLDPIVMCLLTIILFDNTRLFAEMLFVIVIFSVVIFDIVKFIALISVAVTLFKLEIPVAESDEALMFVSKAVLLICILEVDILVHFRCVVTRFVVVCVVLFKSGTVKELLMCILPVLRFEELTVPSIDILGTLRLDIVDDVIVVRLSCASVVDDRLPVLRLILATVPNMVVLFT
jgi:hypothetical protein